MQKKILFTLAIGTAISVSTIYLSQPLLAILREQFQSSVSDIGLIITLTQIGYALGIFTLVPLGDIINKKKLIQIKLLLLISTLLLAGFSQSLLMFFFASMTIGLFATSAQDFVPLAADLAKEQERGKTIGFVMSGLLLGILLSRTFSGFLAEHVSWQSVFFITAFLISIIFIFVTILIPYQIPHSNLKYFQLIHSMSKIFLKNSILPLSVVSHGLIGVIFSSFWTVLTFYLSEPPFNLNSSHIGLFGLAGAAGAIAAPIAGRYADKIGPLLNIKIAILLIFFSFLLLFIFQHSIVVLIIGVVTFDLGVQVSLISHQSIIYSLDTKARSRINSIFVTILFLFFSLGSFLGSILFHHFGWKGELILSLLCCVLSFGIHLILSEKYKKFKLN
ncbi:MFS transporter [Pigmentibacter sp. JX0631]|uniref:MFS transporter n=1 Tax=Pigmentibacter sp. JX0631 TaxID=2976982 RepID=UPI002469930D|nr:MFS transporter [Pigmentibacter sp. JX0631]WGL60783.1 MFS transporter [Pigmentibacter sp. JX0631]